MCVRMRRETDDQEDCRGVLAGVVVTLTNMT